MTCSKQPGLRALTCGNRRSRDYRRRDLGAGPASCPGAGAVHTGTKIHTLIPNPVQHRGVPSLASKRGGGLGRGPLPTIGPSKESTCESSARGACSRRAAPAPRRS